MRYLSAILTVLAICAAPTVGAVDRSGSVAPGVVLLAFHQGSEATRTDCATVESDRQIRFCMAIQKQDCRYAASDMTQFCEALVSNNCVSAPRDKYSLCRALTTGLCALTPVRAEFSFCQAVTQGVCALAPREDYMLCKATFGLYRRSQ